MGMEISLKEALVGFERTVEQLDGRDVMVKKDSVTPCEDVFVVRGEGMPRKSGRGFGDLIVTSRSATPNHSPKSRRTLLRKPCREVMTRQRRYGLKVSPTKTASLIHCGS